MKIPRTATAAAAAAASCQRHEAAAQKRKLSTQVEATEAAVIESKQNFHDVRLARDRADRWERLNCWMVQKAFAMRADCTVLRTAGARANIHALTNIWSNVLPDEVSESREIGFGFGMDEYSLDRARQNPHMRQDLITHIALTFAQHCLAALLEADGNKTEADQIRANLERRPE